MMEELIARIVGLAFRSREGHIPSSLSILNILDVVYGKTIRKEDHFVLSKGHASLGLYAILEKYDLLEDDLDTFCQFDSRFGGHPSNKLKNVKASTGSLGHGLPIAVGLALGEKIKKSVGRTYVLIGDGESNEGTIWEAALLASQHGLNNITCVMDYNHSGTRAVDMGDVCSKFRSFKWDCLEIDGHDPAQIEEALAHRSDRPIFIKANTIKGKGIDRMENNHEWHHKSPTEEEYGSIIKELNEKTIR